MNASTPTTPAAADRARDLHSRGRGRRRAPRLLPRSLALTLGLLMTLPALAAAAPRRQSLDLCLVNRSAPGASALNTLVFQDFEPLSPGRSVAVKGFYIGTAQRASAFSGSAVMTSTGSVRLGLFVHSSATPSSAGTYLNDFTLSGITDEFLVGELKYDNDGDFVPNGALPFELADCATITIP